MKFIHIHTLSIAALLLSSCVDSDVLEQYVASLTGHYLTISTNNLSYTSEGGTKSAQVSTNKTPWSFKDNPSWLQISPSQGGSSMSVDITVEENLSSDTTRTCVFYLTSEDESWNYKNYISAFQAAASSFLKIEKNSLIFSGSASIQTVGVFSNTELTASVSEGWIKAEIAPDCKSIEISVEENLTGLSRTANVSVFGSISRVISVTQQAADMTGETSIQHFSCDGGNNKIKFNSEVAWTAITSSAWINVTPKEGGAGDNAISVSVLPNSSTSERTDYVYLRIGEQNKLQIPVVQDGIYIHTSKSQFTFDAYSCERQLVINSNTDWEILTKPEWISVSATSHKGDLIVSLTALENPELYERRGLLRIGQKGFSYSVDVEVIQSAMNADTDHTQLQFSDVASTTSFTLSTEGTWTASTSDSWIHITPTSGTGNAIIKISVDENETEQERVGSIIIKIGNVSKEIRVVQSSKYFSYSIGDLEIASTGGVIKLSLNTNEDWKVSSNVPWVSLSKTEGFANADIYMAVADNASISARDAKIIISPVNSQSVELSIRQAARYLTTDRTSLNFWAKGGTSEVITISTDGNFKISTDQDWLTIEQVANTFTVTAEKNTSNDSRTGSINIELVGLSNNEEYVFRIPVKQTGISKIIIIDYDGEENWN